MARPKIEISELETEQLAKMAGLGLTMDQMAHILGASKDTLERRMKDSENVCDAIERGRTQATMKVMDTAYGLATSGQHPATTMFWLKCRAQWKEKTEIDINPQPGRIVFQTRIGSDGQIHRHISRDDDDDLD